MKWSLILSILVVFMFFASYSKSDFGRKIAQHFYFQTTFIVVLIVVFVSKIIHLRLNLISMISLIILGCIIYMSLPNYIQQTYVADFLASIDDKIKTEFEIHTLLLKQKQYLLANLFI